MIIPITAKIKNPTTGWANDSQLAMIEHWAKEVPENGVIVEIGSFAGRSAWHWAKAAHPSVTVYAVDSWDPTIYRNYQNRRNSLRGDRIDKEIVECTYEDFCKNTYDCPNIIGVKARSPDLPDHILNKLTNVDLIYIDDSHVNPGFEDNLQFWYKRLKPKGVFCGDDFHVRDVFSSVVNFSIKNKKQLYARSCFWRLYDWDTELT
jgi:SAM-dependent methyltransferase